jgi:phosphoserine phosphatase
MPLVATLVSSPKDRAVSLDLAHRAAKALGASATRWLAPEIACDLDLPAVSEAAATAAIRETLADEPIDVVVQEAATRRKRILLADMDSTMIGEECIDELAAEIGIRTEVAAITARSMNGEIAFEPALRERVALLAGLDIVVIDRLIATRITLAPGGVELVRTMRANGCWTAMVSGGFESFTGPIAAMIGFDEHRANRLIAAEGKLTGLVAEPILGRSAKADALDDIAARLGLSAADAIAVGDGANDLDMIRRAGTGVALHAKPLVAREARIRIDHGDLTALLYIQGYRQSEFHR